MGLEHQQLYQPGESVAGRYRIVQNVGYGASGEVYIAKDLIQDETIAIKFLKSRPDKPTWRERFKEEFAIMKHINHPHIAIVYDFERDVATDCYFYTSELIRGLDFFKATELASLKEMENYFVEALRALEHLHSHNLVHFDIKPQNMLVGKDGVKLIDFGLASSGYEGKIKGTVPYMSPEMVRRENPDHRSDLYSLGVIMYYALTRKNPFKSANQEETFENHRTLQPVAPSKYPNSEARVKIPDYLDEIILRLLEKKPTDRYPNAASVIFDLNLRSGQSYPIETQETLHSYIPSESRFVGRQKELDKIRDNFHRAIQLEPEQRFVILVEGDRGTGKSRFLKELRYTAQLLDYSTFSLDEQDSNEIAGFIKALEKSSQDLHQSNLFLLDDSDLLVERQSLSRLFHLIGKIIQSVQLTQRLAKDSAPVQVRFAFSFSKKATDFIRELGLLPEVIERVNLENFTYEELTRYLTAVTGLESPPESLVADLFSHTEGNPFYITEILKSLVSDELLFDAAGRWTATTFEDMGVDFSRVRISQNLEEAARADFSKLTEDERDIIAVLSVWGRPVFQYEIEAILGANFSETTLRRLGTNDLISFSSATRQYAFQNRIKAKAVRHLLSESERQQLHDRIVRFLDKQSESGPVPENDKLYHIAHGSDPARASEALLSLGKFYMTNYQLHESRQAYQEHLERFANIEGSLEWISDMLNIARTFKEEGRDFETALNHYQKIEKYLDPHNEPALCEKVYEEQGDIYAKRQMYDLAKEKLVAALHIVATFTKEDLSRIRIENSLAQIGLLSGHAKRSIQSFKWSRGEARKLPSDQQKQVINNDLAYAYLADEDFERAKKQFIEDIIFYREIGHLKNLARSIYLLGETCRRLKQFDEAEQYFQEGLLIAKQTDDLKRLFDLYNALGNNALDQLNPESLSYYQRARELCGHVGSLNDAVVITLNMGIAHREMENYKEAIQCFKSLISYSKGATVHPAVLCNAYIQLGETYRIDQQRQMIESPLREAEKLAMEYDSCRPHLFWIRDSFVEILRDEGRLKEARALNEKNSELADTLDKKKQYRKTTESLKHHKP